MTTVASMTIETRKTNTFRTFTTNRAECNKSGMNEGEKYTKI